MTEANATIARPPRWRPILNNRWPMVIQIMRAGDAPKDVCLRDNARLATHHELDPPFRPISAGRTVDD